MVQSAMKGSAERAKKAMQEGAAQKRKVFEQGKDAAKQAARDMG